MDPLSNFTRRFAPLVASIAMIGSCCYLYDLPPKPTPPPPPTPTPACQMAFTNPSSAAVLGDSGPVDFTWTGVKDASFYLLSLSVPNGIGKTTFTVNGTSRTLYMDSFQDGNFHAEVQARDPANDILCIATLDFSTEQQVKAHKKPGSSGGSGGSASDPTQSPPK